MSFEENMTAFYMAFAEQRVEQACQSLSNMRLAVAADRSQGAAGDDSELREEMLRACELKAEGMKDAALAQLRQACAAGSDVDRVLNAFFLCAELGAAADAAEPFAGCFARIFRTQASASLERVYASKKAAAVNEHGYIDRTFYVDGMSEIMTGATDIMNAVADVTADSAVLERVLAPIHAACADNTLEIVQMYAVDARMAAWERRAIDQARLAPSEQIKMEIEPDESLQMVDLFLDELSFIIRVIMSYVSFLKTVCEALDADKGGAFNVKVQELSGVYLLLERFYIFQSVRKATAIAEVQELEANVFVSSIVEDVSFVINKAFFRSSQVMSYHTALSIVIAIVDALQSMYLPAILELPSRPFAIPIPSASGSSPSDTPLERENSGEKNVSFSDMLLQAVDEDLTRSVQVEARRIMTINSAFMSRQFVEGFESKVDEFSRASFPYDASIIDCLPTHISELSESFRSIVDNEVQQVLTAGLRTRLQELVRRHMAETFVYELTSAQYDAFGLQGSPLSKLMEREVMKNALLRRYEQTLCRAPFEALVECFVRDLTQWIASALLDSRKRFNDLGALQLEREATQLLDRVSEYVRDTSLRAAFTRLFQVVLILNLMQPTHVVDYLDSVRQELSDSEIAQLLRLRVDFKPDDVKCAIEQLQSKQ